MATQRYISTSFWDDPWVTTLNKEEKLLYLYFLTNPLTNIAGVYQISLRRMIFDTQLTEAEVREIIKGFEKKGKAFFFNSEYIILPSWPKHQKWQEKKKIETGIIAILKVLSPNLLGFLVEIGYTYPIDKLQIPYAYEPNYLDLDRYIDPDSDNIEPSPDSESEPEETAQVPEPVGSTPPVPALSNMKDPLAQHYQELITAIQPDTTWGDYGKERQQINNLAKKTDNLFPSLPYEDKYEMATEIVKKFMAMKEDQFWKARDKPVVPSSVASCWAEIIEVLRQDFADEQETAEYSEVEIF